VAEDRPVGADETYLPESFRPGEAMLAAAPALIVLVALVVTGFLSILGGILGAMAALGFGFLFAWRRRRALGYLAAFLDRLGADLPPDPTLRERAVILASLPERTELSEALARAERRWQERGEKMRSITHDADIIIDGLPDPLFLLDADGNVVRANQAAHGLFPGRITDRPIAGVLRDPDVLDAIEYVLEERLDGRGDGLVVELSLPVPTTRTFSASVQPLDIASSSDAPTSPYAVLIELRDVTEIKRSEQMRGDFVANVSHELRTPLSSLVGFIETLRGPARDDPEAQDHFLAIMDQQAARMTRIVEDLLSLSRIELHEHTAPTGRVKVPLLIRKVIDPLQFAAASKQIGFDVRIPDGLPMVVGEESELSQVFSNLIDNAIKYGHEGSTVRVAARVSEDSPVVAAGADRAVVIAVQDSSDGIPKAHLPRLTERFYRVDTARSRELGGTGLGLAIVKHIVNRHRGVLLIDSELGVGSTFSVHLPGHAAPARAAIEHD